VCGKDAGSDPYGHIEREHGGLWVGDEFLTGEFERTEFVEGANIYTDDDEDGDDEDGEY
jgi:hypothetical protein